MENWIDIKGYENMYQVSDLGRVRSLDRTTSNTHRLKGIILMQYPNSDGYLHVGLCKDGIQNVCKVHHLVIDTFEPALPNELHLVRDHKGNDKLNNKLDNLQRITKRENSSKDSKSELAVGVGYVVDSNKNPYKAQILYNGSHIHLGVFSTEQLASEYYQKQLLRIKDGLGPIKIVAVKESGLPSGVAPSYRKKTPYMARVWLDGKYKYLGRYSTPELAHEAYLMAKERIKKGLHPKD